VIAAAHGGTVRLAAVLTRPARIAQTERDARGQLTTTLPRATYVRAIRRGAVRAGPAKLATASRYARARTAAAVLRAIQRRAIRCRAAFSRPTRLAAAHRTAARSRALAMLTARVWAAVFDAAAVVVAVLISVVARAERDAFGRAAARVLLARVSSTGFG
jgi:hypothetical protein